MLYFYWIDASRLTEFICIKMGIGQLFDVQHFFKCSAAFPQCFAGSSKSLDVTHRNIVECGATEMSHGQVDQYRNGDRMLAFKRREPCDKSSEKCNFMNE